MGQARGGQSRGRQCHPAPGTPLRRPGDRQVDHGRPLALDTKVTGDRVVLTYVLPVPPKEMVEAMPVPPIVQYGGAVQDLNL